MRLRSDIHALLSALAQPEKLPQRMADAITSHRNTVYASPTSLVRSPIQAILPGCWPSGSGKSNEIKSPVFWTRFVVYKLC